MRHPLLRLLVVLGVVAVLFAGVPTTQAAPEDAGLAGIWSLLAPAVGLDSLGVEADLGSLLPPAADPAWHWWWGGWWGWWPWWGWWGWWPWWPWWGWWWPWW